MPDCNAAVWQADMQASQTASTSESQQAGNQHGKPASVVASGWMVSAPTCLSSAMHSALPRSCRLGCTSGVFPRFPTGFPGESEPMLCIGKTPVQEIVFPPFRIPLSISMERSWILGWFSQENGILRGCGGGREPARYGASRQAKPTSARHVGHGRSRGYGSRDHGLAGCSKPMSWNAGRGAR